METLIIVDVQNDFCPDGALAVPQGDQVLEPLNRLGCAAPYVAATRDWHPPDHGSFAEQGGRWPVHCVRDTDGAQLHPGLDQSMQPGDGERALAELVRASVRVQE